MFFDSEAASASLGIVKGSSLVKTLIEHSAFFDH